MNNEVYQKVAERCSSFSPSRDTIRNSSNNEEISCKACRHFDSNEYCSLDLYDKIVDEYNI